MVAALEFDRRALGEANRTIAHATGVLSARMHITLDEAADVLARTADRCGTSPLHVARELIDTGALPEQSEHQNTIH